MVRTESDLCAVLRTLEPDRPDRDGVLNGVRRRVARRRLAQTGGSLGGVAAVVTAVVLVTGPGPIPPSPTVTPRVQTADFIIKHAASAEKNAARMIQVTRDGAGVDYMSVATQQTLFISSLRIHGRPLLASSEAIKGTTYTSTLVDYKDRAYNIISASTRDSGPWGAKGIVIGSWLPGVTASDPVAAYTAALRKGIIKVIGYRNFHGRRTILIKLNGGKFKRATACKPSSGGKSCFSPGRSCKSLPTGRVEVWLDATTYLEIAEAKITPKFVGPPSCPKFTGWSTDLTKFQWLRPTKHNLALLNLTPPAGFTRVSSHQMGVYLGPYS